MLILNDICWTASWSSSTRTLKTTKKNSWFWLAVLLWIQSCCWSASARNYRHTNAELARTNQVVINARNCAPDETPIFVHTAAQTSGKYYERRMTIRRTWAREASKYRMRVLFVVGVPPSFSKERQIKAEARKYGDLIQFNFLEDYYNLTLKAISLLKWSYRHCGKSRYMVKTDDDVIVNMPMLFELVKQKKIPTGLTGLIMTTPANREFGHKWYMPHEYYKKNSYEFLAGFSYLLSMDRLKQFLKTIITYPGPILDIDDLFLTGVIADYGRIKRNNSFRFKFFCGIDVCTMETSLVIHACSDNPKNTEIMYRNWKGSDRTKCYRHLKLNRNQRRRVGRSIEETNNGTNIDWNSTSTSEMLALLGAEQTVGFSFVDNRR